MSIPPDTKDWTWVLNRPCSECGFEASNVAFESIPALARESAQRIAFRLGRPDAAVRPSESVWSPLEYAAHVRDVCAVFAYRVQIGASDAPTVPGFDPVTRFVDGVPLMSNWDQDETAAADSYSTQQPAVVAEQLINAAENMGRVLEDVAEADRALVIRRSDGAQFTVESLSQYFIHDLVHHVHDVRA